MSYSKLDTFIEVWINIHYYNHVADLQSMLHTKFDFNFQQSRWN